MRILNIAKTVCLSIVFILTITAKLNAQQLMHSFGLTLSVLKGTLQDGGGNGFGYNKVTISESSYSNFNGSSYGPLFRAGFRFGSARESWNGHGITAGAYYKIGLEKNKLSTIGFNVLYDL